ncbi:sulfurtransferase [Kovacikia minuta CCNUW1]|uniref:sulfurtransferase n=1 Tax=Kovacikia minuta TaxID=2931930 RepID=UPI001CCEFDF4|nr:sulfurtransferase [Kovacikia minuta]UBF28333.1 sulfurtransferase [Kovacikia minuta CCNUW1]
MTSSVVSAAWLNEHLHDSQVAIVDCRFSLMQPELGQQQYQASHIPGAYFLDLNQDLSGPVEKHGGRHPLPDGAILAGKLETMGISSNPPAEPTLVVAYDDSRQAFAARLWWLLRHLGHEHVAVLDGGFAAWAAGYAVSTEIHAPKAGKFIPEPHLEQVVDIEQVKERKDLPGVVLVDSREGDRYRGEREPIDPIAGHIPSAVNYPWQGVTNDQGYLLPAAEQRQHWTKLAQAEEILVYCGSGVTACVNLLSLELAGIQTGRLYPGGWSDWCSHLERIKDEG